MKTIVDRINEQRTGGIYHQCAKQFKTSYRYVWQVAAGRRKATRGKGREIKEWLEKQLKKR